MMEANEKEIQQLHKSDHDLGSTMERKIMCYRILISKNLTSTSTLRLLGLSF